MAARFAILILCCSVVRADERAEFFEKKIRPVLVEHCFKCHSAEAKNPKGGLRLDSRAAILNGGDNGPAIVSGDPAKSRMIEALRYANVDLQMPPKGKLTANVVADIEKWVKDGAVWPGDEGKVAPVEAFDLAKRKAGHWAWQPVKVTALPGILNKQWPRDPVDQFILAKLEEKKLAPAVAASKSVWLRRVTFALTGLPPTVKEIEDFEKDDSPTAFEAVADRLLASPAYGERWARHWLDLVRYAETRGHESDFEIANAWIYRDYVIRAFNEDVPYSDFAIEQICGEGSYTRFRDLNIEGDKNINEPIIGTAFWRLGEELHSPVDIRQDQADRLDNRIDVFGKTFLGLTISCARCHDHKFDAISTRDYYSLVAVLEAGSDTPLRTEGLVGNTRIRAQRFRISRDAAPRVELNPLQKQAYDKWRQTVTMIRDFSRYAGRNDDDNIDSYDRTLMPAHAGEASLRLIDGREAIVREPRGAIVYDRYWEKLTLASYTNMESGKLGSYMRAGYTIRSPLFKLEKENVYLLVRGGGASYAAVGGHTLLQGPLHGGLVYNFKNADDYRWVKHPLKEYRGQTFRMEVSADPKTEFAIAMIVQSDSEPELPPAPTVTPLAETEQRAALEKIGSLPAPVWKSRLVPGVVDGASIGEHVFIRGNPRTLGELVEPRMPEAFDYAQKNALFGHVILYDFARKVVDRRNPLLTRVIVNRLWHHLFGRGIVASTDNFGVLGERPSHPELLDYLATEFEKGGYKIKPFLKRLVLTQTYRMSSQTTNHERDPANHLLHHFRIKRLEGEAIRDAMLAVSGRLDIKMFGPPVPMHLTPFMDGRGKPEKSGPLDGDGRRSIYLAVRRNFLSPFLLAFDTPIPFSTVGTRQVSNVPAQALILMNDPFVHEQAKLWGKNIAAEQGSVEDRIAKLYLRAFTRKPNNNEILKCRELLGDKPDEKTWTAFAHCLFQVNEFRYLP